jgi:hypothetical protein
MVAASLGSALAAGCVAPWGDAEPVGNVESVDSNLTDGCAAAAADVALTAVNNDFLGQTADSVDGSYSQRPACKAFVVNVFVASTLTKHIVANSIVVAPAAFGQACELFRETILMYHRASLTTPFARIGTWTVHGHRLTDGSCELVPSNLDISCSTDDHLCELPEMVPPNIVGATYRFAIAARTVLDASTSIAHRVQLHIASKLPQL